MSKRFRRDPRFKDAVETYDVWVGKLRSVEGVTRWLSRDGEREALNAVCEALSEEVTALNGQPSVNRQNSWLHNRGEIRPDRFSFGPLHARRDELGYAIRCPKLRIATTEKAHRNYFNSHGHETSETLYIIESSEREPLEVWFANRDKHIETAGAVSVYRNEKEKRRKLAEANGSQRKKKGTKRTQNGRRRR